MCLEINKINSDEFFFAVEPSVILNLQNRLGERIKPSVLVKGLRGGGGGALSKRLTN